MFKNIRNLYQLVRVHPLTRNMIWMTFIRILCWQLAVRLLHKSSFIVKWVDTSRLVMEKGLVGATGNHYFGLHEFEDMSFLLHFLSKDDLFVDIGSNVGSYTVLAGAVREARVIAVEPIPETYRRLMDNININGISNRTHAVNIGLGAEDGMLKFSNGLDAENHVINFDQFDLTNSIDIPVRRLDDLLVNERPVMIKLDVEGFESEVIRGGGRVFASPQLQALIIELNGSGLRYGYDENNIRDQLEKFGFNLCKYDPYSRLLRLIDRNELPTNNSLYVRDLKKIQSRLSNASRFHVLNQYI